MAYDGQAYCGWQRQPNVMTVQEMLESKLSLLHHQPVFVTGCGRTDTGVHAYSYWLHYDLIEPIDTGVAVYALNGMLPPDIRVREIQQVRDDFHARFDASSREYRYFIHTRPSPFLFNRSYYMHRPLDIKIMNEAGNWLKGVQDFGSFCKSGGGSKTNICKLDKAVWCKSGDKVIFIVRADRFLRNMVRAMVGTMLELGEHKISLTEFKNIISGSDRRLAGQSAPAHGLYLWDIKYDKDFSNR